MTRRGNTTNYRLYSQRTLIAAANGTQFANTTQIEDYIRSPVWYAAGRGLYDAEYTHRRCCAENKKPFDEVIRTAEGSAYVRQGKPDIAKLRKKAGQKQVAS